VVLSQAFKDIKPLVELSERTSLFQDRDTKGGHSTPSHGSIVSASQSNKKPKNDTGDARHKAHQPFYFSNE